MTFEGDAKTKIRKLLETTGNCYRWCCLLSFFGWLTITLIKAFWEKYSSDKIWFKLKDLKISENNGWDYFCCKNVEKLSFLKKYYSKMKIGLEYESV